MTKPLSRLAGLGRAVVALLLVLAPLPAAATEVEKVVSPGGITAWLVSEDAVPLIAMDFAFRGGAAQDPPGKAGAANLMTALLDEGAGDLDEVAFKRRLEDAAVLMGFGAERDALTGSLTTLATRRDEAVDLLAMALARPRFDEGPFERISTQISTRLLARQNDPETIAGRLFTESTFPDHPYGRPVDGTPESLRSISREDVVALHRRTMARDNLVVGVVGAITAEELGPLLDRAFGGLPERADLDEVPPVEPRLGLTLTAEANEPQTLLRIAGPGVLRRDDDFMAAFVMNHILGGGGFSSRLYEEIREQRGLAYSASSSLVTLDRAALTVAATATRPASADEVLGLMRGIAERMAAEGPTEAELAEAKRFLIGNYALRFDTSSSIAGQLVGLQLDGMPIDYFTRRNDLVAAVTIEDVRRVARRLLGGPLTVLTVGPSPG